MTVPCFIDSNAEGRVGEDEHKDMPSAIHTCRVRHSSTDMAPSRSLCSCWAVSSGVMIYVTPMSASTAELDCKTYSSFHRCRVVVVILVMSSNGTSDTTFCLACRSDCGRRHAASKPTSLGQVVICRFRLGSWANAFFNAPCAYGG